jgi:HKD family nuclease
MAQSKDTFRKKILDYWEKPDGAGEPVGCLCTSFTFDASLFETKCLGRFFGIEPDPEEESTRFQILFEANLQHYGNANVFVDKRHSKGARSLRWKLLPVDLPGAAFHPKIQILAWSKRIRIIIGSANITNDGYRYNDEAFFVADFADGADASQQLLEDALSFFELINDTSKSSDNTHDEINRLIKRISEIGKSFDLEEPSVPYYFTTVHPNSKSLFDQIKSITANKVFDTARIESPSFDRPGTKNEPAVQIWNLLRQRGDAEVTYCLRGRIDEASKSISILAPKELDYKPNRAGCSIVYRINNEHIDEKLRNAHRKYLELANDRWKCITIGSSNFSRQGLGLDKDRKKTCNFEANVTFLLDLQADRKTRTQFEALVDHHPEADFKSNKVIWQDDQVSTNDDTVDSPYPSFISYIQFKKVDGKPFIQLKVNKTGHSFTIKRTTESSPLITINNSKIQEYDIPTSSDSPTSELIVEWDGHTYPFPVVITSQDDLATPDFLTNATLEEITELFSSKVSLDKALARYLRRKEESQAKSKSIIHDPHARVNTSGFILRKTALFSRAMKAYRDRLEEPVGSEEALQWRLNGPIGIQAIKKILLANFISQDEKAFFLVEIIKILSLVNPSNEKGSLPPSIIFSKIKVIIASLKAELDTMMPSLSPAFTNYISSATGNAHE